MSAPSLNKGVFAPVADESDSTAFTVTGEIPEELNGSLLRNGPNPFSGEFAGNDVLAWWPEAAMLHSISFRNGKATVYRNRWVHNKNWGNYFANPRSEQCVDSNPNVNIIEHAGNILALAEGGQPIAISSELGTLGASEMLGSFSEGMTAHPKKDPITKELITFRADWNPPWLRYGVIDCSGTTSVDIEIAIPAPAMTHDMAITETYSILFDLNVAFDFSLLQLGHRIPICWQDARQSRLGIMPRHGGTLTWLEIQPCFIQHVVNAYDMPNNTIILDVVRYPSYFNLDPVTQKFRPNPLGVLWRYTIDLQEKKLSEQQLSELNIELPRINELYTGRPYRYLYAAEQPTDDEFRGIVRFDLETETTQHHLIDEGDQNSEAIFVPRPNALSEDDGWILFCVYKKATDTSEIRILDAKNISDPPLAIVSLARRIPAGFHGAWIPAKSGALSR